MAVTSNVFSVGTAGVKVVTDSGDSQDVILQNLEPAANSDDLARAGYLYLVQSKFDLGGSAVSYFNMATPAGGAQIEFYEIASTAEPVYAELIEGGTPTTTSTVVSYNINRTEADDAATVLTAASAYAGGSVVSAELITGSKQGGGGGGTFAKIHTLKPSANYGFRFTNLTNQSTTCFVQVAFSEKFNGQNGVWIGEGLNDGAFLGGGAQLQMRLQAGQTLWAISEESAQLAVLRQD